MCVTDFGVRCLWWFNFPASSFILLSLCSPVCEVEIVHFALIVWVISTHPAKLHCTSVAQLVGMLQVYMNHKVHCHGICVLPIYLEIQFFLSVSSLTFNDFTAQHMSKLRCMPNISLKHHNSPILSMFFFFYSHNSITIIPIGMKLDV